MPNVFTAGCRAAPLGIVLAGALSSSVASADPIAPSKVDEPARGSLYTQEGLLGPVRAGPTVGLGAPDGVRFGLFAKWKGVLSAGGAFSYLPTMNVPGADAAIVRVSGEAFARVHPFRGAFFLGVAGGYAQTKGTMTEVQTAFRQDQRVEAHAYAKGMYVAPHMGFQWMLPLNFTVGFDVGVEIPVGKSGVEFDAAKYGLVVPVDGKGTVADATRQFSSMPIPVVHLLEIGYAL